MNECPECNDPDCEGDPCIYADADLCDVGEIGEEEDDLYDGQL